MIILDDFPPSPSLVNQLWYTLSKIIYVKRYVRTSATQPQALTLNLKLSDGPIFGNLLCISDVQLR
jgi:hypothetical protein